MNILKNKKISLALKTAGVMAVSTSILGLSIGMESSVHSTNKIMVRNNFLNKSDNEINAKQLENPKYYFNNFMFMDPDKGDSTTAELEKARIQWSKIKETLEKWTLDDGSQETSSYEYISKKLIDLEDWAEILEVREALRAAGKIDLWDSTIAATLNYKPFADIVGEAAELSKNVQLLSGFVSGSSVDNQIKSIQNKGAVVVELTDGSETAYSPSSKFMTEITIAEIDLTVVGDFKIDFQFSNSNSQNPHILANGSLIIRNKDGQLTSTLASNESNLEIFGRWTNLGRNNKIDDATNFKSVMDNFVLTKVEDKILLIARLKDGDQLSNIKVDSSNGGPQVESFGIINSQQVDSKPLYPTSGDEVVQAIKFFSTNLELTDAEDPASVSANAAINKKYEFYVGDNTSLDLELFYKNKREDVYKTLFGFEGNEESITKKQMLKAGVQEGVAANISATKTEFSLMVLEEMGVLPSDASNLSMTLSTQKDDTKLLWKQGIYFNDLLAFSFFGPPEISPLGSAIISLKNNITDKIFFENPEFASTAKPDISSSTAKDWTNDDSEIVQALADVYTKWSQDGTIGSTPIGVKSYNTITYSKKGQNFQDISWKSSTNNYTGIETYNALVNEFQVYQQILFQLLGSPVSTNIYEIGPGGTAGSIVKTQLFNIQDYAFLSSIKQNVQDIIDGDASTIDKEKLIEKELQELIRINFLEMTTSLIKPINQFYYTEIRKYLESSLSLNKTIVADVSTFLTFNVEEGVFNLKGENPPILKDALSLTGSQKMESLFKMLYFGSKEYGSGELMFQTYFGNSIFGGESSSRLESFISYADATKQKELWTFETTIYQNQQELINIYDSLLSVFGFGINAITENSFKTGQKIELKWENYNFESAIGSILEQLESSSHVTTNILGSNYNLNMLNYLITSSNIYNSLLFRKNNPPQGIESPEKDAQKIDNLLNAGITSFNSIFTWSRVQKVGNDIELYTVYFSKNLSETIKFSNEIKTRLDILDVFIEEQESLFKMNNAFVDVQIVWPIIIGLIAVGLIVVSSVSLVTGSRKVAKFNSTTIKTILIVVILISLVSLGLIGGLVIPGLL